MKELEYSYIQSEKDKNMVVFIKIEPEWLDKDLNFGIIENKFVIELNHEKYESKEIEVSLLENLNKNSIPVIFANKEGDLLAEFNLPQIQSKKVKP